MAPIYIKNPAFVADKDRKEHSRLERLGVVPKFDDLVHQNGGNYYYLRVPCGKCEACLARRSEMWTTRLCLEDSYSKTSWFVTLTYDECNVPVLCDDGSVKRGCDVDSLFEVPRVLKKKDFQDFFKRFRYYLRKELHLEDDQDLPISYFCCGEYGGKFGRPHYHMLLFFKQHYVNFDFVSKCVNEAWKNGQYKIGNVTPKSCRYCAKYSLKKSNCPVEEFPPFALMSKGISSEYVEDFYSYHGDDPDKMYVVLDGRKTLIPRYLKDRIFSRESKAEFADKMQRKFDKDPSKEKQRIDKIHYKQEIVRKRKFEKDQL